VAGTPDPPDGKEFLPLAEPAKIRTCTAACPLADVNAALDALRAGHLRAQRFRCRDGSCLMQINANWVELATIVQTG
jgi:hypothetical protein